MALFDLGLAPHCWAVFLAMSRSVWNGPSPIRPRNHGPLDVTCDTWEETWSRCPPRNRRQKFYHEAPTTTRAHTFPSVLCFNDDFMTRTSRFGFCLPMCFELSSGYTVHGSEIWPLWSVLYPPTIVPFTFFCELLVFTCWIYETIHMLWFNRWYTHI